MVDNILVIACMKDEGPYILEWVAYHRSIGVTDFVVITNDCSDGTDRILDRLDTLGWVRHMPNPSMLGIPGAPIQHVAIAYAQMTKEFRRADWVLIIDADEYLNIKVGTGTIDELLAKVGDIDAISFNQVVFGSSGIVDLVDEPTLRQFRHRFKFDIPMRANFPRMYGIKTLARNDGKLFRRHANHRPIPFPRTRTQLRWVDGAGIGMQEEFLSKLPRGHRTEAGTHALGYVNHYAVRSAQSFIVQSFRGDAVSASIRRDVDYWRQYDRNEVEDTTILPMADRADEVRRLLLQDEELNRLHEAAARYHQERVTVGLKNADVRKLYDAVLASVNNSRD